MKFVFRYFSLILLVGMTVSAGRSSWGAPALKVVTTTTTIQSLVEFIGKDRVMVNSLARGPQDPHFLEAKPSYMVQMRQADLLVANGLDLEVGWLPNLLTGARQPHLQKGAKGYLELGQYIDPLERPQGKVDRSQGDVHPHGNPHFSLDPERAMRAAEVICKKLTDLDPSGGSIYEKNFADFKNQLARKTEEWTKRVTQAQVGRIVTYHKTVNYFLHRFGLELVSTIEPKAGIPPSPRHLVDLIERMKQKNVRCILYESFFHEEGADKIRAALPSAVIQVVATEVKALPKINNYFELIDGLVRAIEACALKGEKS